MEQVKPLPYPSLGIQVKILDLAVVKEASEANSIICQVQFLANDGNFIFPGPGIELQDLLTASSTMSAVLLNYSYRRGPTPHKSYSHHAQANNHELLSRLHIDGSARRASHQNRWFNRMWVTEVRQMSMAPDYLKGTAAWENEEKREIRKEKTHLSGLIGR